MTCRLASCALLHLGLLLILVMTFSNLPVTVHADALPDLTVDGIWLEDASQPGQPVTQLSPGQSFNIVATLKNLGQATASGYYIDVYYDSDYGRGGPDQILAGEAQTWYVGPLTAQDGTHTTRWVVDPDNLIIELDESNNLKEYTFTIGQQTTPTLTLAPTSGSAGTLVTASGSDYQGTTCLLTAAPSNLFISQACSIVAGVLTGSFTVDSVAYAGSYAVAVQTNAGLSDSATSSFTVAPTYVVTVFARKTDGSTLSGAQVTFGSETKTTNSTGQAEFSVLAGAFALGVQSPLVGGSGVQFVFTQWADGDTRNPRSTTISGSVSFDATYKTQYKLMMQVNPVGSATTNPAVGTYWYDSGQNVSIQASPASGNKLRSWTGSGSGSYTGTANPASAIMSGPLNETAILVTTINGPPAISSLTSGKPSPQVAGSSVTWNCSATDPEGDPILYRLWTRLNGGAWAVARDWSTSGSWSWSPSSAGTWDIACHVRDGKHAGVNGWDDHKEFYTYSVLAAPPPPPNNPPEISSLSPDNASPQVAGTTITWTCSASDMEGDSILYRFFVQPSGGSWRLVQDWSTSNAWSWASSAAGSFNVACHVRDGKHAGVNGWDDHKEAFGYSVLAAPPAPLNNSPKISSLSPDKTSSTQVVAATITWTCLATDAENDSISYRFFVRSSGRSWSVARDWSGLSTWSWTPTAAGSYDVACHVRDGKHRGSSGWDDHKEAFGYSVLSAPPNNPPTVSSLMADKVSGSQVAGSTITWTCSASDADGDSILYRFFVRASARSWSVVQDWSSSNAWAWTPTGAGSYDVACHVRDGKHAGSTGWDDHKEAFGYSVLSAPPNNPPTVSSLMADKVSGSQAVGATITWTCSASDTEGDSILYRFFVRSSGGSWSMVRDWSTVNAWAWTPTGAGSYDVACHVRDGKHAGSTGWDDHKEVYGYITTLGIPTASLLLNPEMVLSKETVKPNLW